MTKFLFLLPICILLIVSQPTLPKAAPPEALVHDALISTLNPYIAKAVVNHYGYHKQYGLYDAKLLSIERKQEGGFTFIIKVQVTTFEHAHNPPYSIETITLDLDSASVKILKFKHQGDQEEKDIARFYNETLSDIQESFHINMQFFEKYTADQLSYKAERQKEYKSLSDTVTDIIIHLLNPVSKPPLKNVIDPVTFINGDMAYILFKKADGTNVVYEVRIKSGEWKVVGKHSKQGKKMKNKLLWYM